MLLLAVCATLNAQTDSITALRDRGMQLYDDKLYVDAYLALRQYVNDAPDDQRYTVDYNRTYETMLSARHKISGILAREFNEAVSAQKKGRAEEADGHYVTFIRSCVEDEYRHTEDYAKALTQHAIYLQQRGQLDAAIKLLEEAADVRHNGPIGKVERANEGESLNLIASIYNQQGRYDDAISLCTRALDIYRTRYGTKHEYYGTTLSNLASYHASRNAQGDRALAVELGEAAIKIIPKRKPAYAQAINNLVIYYYLAGDMAKAEKLSRDALKKSRKLGENTPSHAAMLSNQAVRMAGVGAFVQAAEYALEAIGIYEHNGDTLGVNFARLLSNAGTFEKRAERYDMAISLWQRAAAIYENTEGRSGTGYLNCMAEISAAHARTGNLEQATNINEVLEATSAESVRTGDVRYAHSLTKRAAVLATDGAYAEAERLSQQALAIFRARGDRAEEAQTMADLSGYYHNQGRDQQAADTCRAALEIYYHLGYHHELEQAQAMNNLSIYLYTLGQTSEARAMSMDAMRLYERSGNDTTSYFANLLSNMALYEASSDSLERALEYSLRADSLQCRILGEGHPDNVMLRYNRSYYLTCMGRNDEAQRLFHSAMQMQMRQVRANFSHLTTRGREQYWGTKSYIFRAAPYMASLMADNDSALVDAYDAMLFTKGLLLNSEVDFRNLLARTASEELQQQYAELAAIHQQLETAYRSNDPAELQQIPALTTEASRLERALVRGCKEFGDFTEAMSISYHQVAGALGELDAAIEFFDIDVPVDGRTYMALVTRCGWEAPRMVRLFCERTVNEFQFNGKTLADALSDPGGINAVFADPRMGQMVWGPIMPLLEGASDVYFSPSGLFYQWGIEYLPYDHRRIGDIFALHRLSSTKLLVQQMGEIDDVRHAAVFGGLNYNASVEQLVAANERQSSSQSSYTEFLATVDEDARNDLAMAQQRSMEGFSRYACTGVDYLPGTQVEANMISNELRERSISTELYLGENGTEEIFKSLSGNKLSLLHIATHGFSFTDDGSEQSQDDLWFLGMSGDNSAQADNSLCYSGLLLAGANNVLEGQVLPDNMENGILTAREIAQLDFTGLQLVVLSACQTGLGQLKEDGVFGLQRGFKKAGARTLLMSLWNVDDNATQVMMSNFYSSLTAGQSYRQAFRSGQEAVRNAGYTAPYYWASFIMLDD